MPEPASTATAVEPKIIPPRPPSRSRKKLLTAGVLVAVPPLIFYTILLRKALNIPYFDDYSAILDFLNHAVLLKTTSARASFLRASQVGQFKLWFLQAVAWLECHLCGYVDFRVLDAMGNGFILVVAFLLWKMFLPNNKELVSRLAWFVPVSWLLFQLQYWDTLDWATTGLQHVPVLAFSLGVIYLLTRPERWAFPASIAFMILAVASDGNGVLTVPIGLLILATGRHYRRAAVWLLASAAWIATYAYGYKLVLTEKDAQGSVFMLQHAGAHYSMFSALLRLNPIYVLNFMGSAGSVPWERGSLLLGTLLCVLFVYLASRGYIRRNPAVSYGVLFLLLTAIGVSCLRSDYRVSQSLSSRYAVYSALFLIFVWIALVEELLQYKRGSLLDNGTYLGAVGISVVFSLLMDLGGARGLDVRNRALAQAMAEFEHPATPTSTPSPAPPAYIPGAQGKINTFNASARAIVIQSVNLGIYRPPPL